MVDPEKGAQMISSARSVATGHGWVAPKAAPKAAAPKAEPPKAEEPGAETGTPTAGVAPETGSNSRWWEFWKWFG